MAASDFFSRWSKRGAEKDMTPEAVSDARPEQLAVVTPVDTSDVEKNPDKAPDMADVAALRDESDFSRFMAKDVDESVRRSAMKKLFSNPHFNVMDGLDIYIDDYGKADPLPPGMLESLLHAKTLLNPLAHLEQGLQRLLDPDPVPVEGEATSTDSEAGPSALAAELVAEPALVELPLSDQVSPVPQSTELASKIMQQNNDESDQNESANKNL
ncbi:DUF3306 domain-containing protein [Undibacterium sp. FT79W]|uniref:DUF3306 domain-containing protein n=1 Tax=Undibacterium sp. FT79W TaxID=2762296 RepID=UPI00164C7153|nr:DUF3306 domain-containing protein [Undibacterium sp. FT79W]MBC3878730.1 DUF3306 domain-containing protein [Undibacterium sp. FT79W]